MSVKIIFPPLAEHALNGPFLAPDLLVAILEKEDISAEAVDLNILFIRKILDPEILKCIIAESVVPTHDLQVLEHFISVPTQQFIQYSTDGLVYILQILRKIVLSTCPTFDSCIDSGNKVNLIVNGIYQELIEDLNIKKGDIIGFTIPFAEQFGETLVLAKSIRMLHPELKILVGGSQINLMNTDQLQLLKNTAVFDVIAKGDGETGIVDLIRNIENYSRTTVLNFSAVTSKILDDLPSPNFKNTEYYFGKLILPVLVTKGCYWGKCSFCDYIKLSKIEIGNYIARKPEAVFNEIYNLAQKYSNTTFFLVSDAIPPPWYKSICSLAVESNFNLNSWSYLIHSDFYDRSFFELLSNAGVKTITFGTETLDNRLLGVLCKSFNQETILQNLQDAADLNFSVTVNIIPDIPTSTYSESVTVFNKLQEILSNLDQLNIQAFALTEGTEIASNPKKFGLEILPSEYVQSYHGFHSLSFKDLKGMTQSEKMTTLKVFYELSLKKKLQKRTKYILKYQIQDDSILFFDPTALVINGEKPELFVGSLKTGFALQNWEMNFYRHILSSPDNSLRFSEIRKLYIQFSLKDVNTFLKYFVTILTKGVFIKAT